MRRVVNFYWLCIMHAWGGCWTRASSSAGLLGGAILWLVLLAISPQLRTRELVEAPTTYWGVAGINFFYFIASVMLAFIVIFLWRLMLAPSRLYWTERDKIDAQSGVGKSQFFKLGERIYSESRGIKWLSNGKDSEFYESLFYLVVGNGLDTGRTLKRVQGRIFHIGEPVLAGVKETGGGEVNIRHGEWAFFEIGRIVSPESMGLIEGTIILDDEAKKQYEHNVRLGHLSYEVRSSSGKRAYGLHYDPAIPNIWSLVVVLSANKALAMQIRVNIDMTKNKAPVSYEVIT